MLEKQRTRIEQRFCPCSCSNRFSRRAPVIAKGSVDPPTSQESTTHEFARFISLRLYVLELILLARFRFSFIIRLFRVCLLLPFLDRALIMYYDDQLFVLAYRQYSERLTVMGKVDPTPMN
jgi:hypothetical protein